MRARVLDHMVRVSVSVIEHMRRGLDGLPWDTAADEIAAFYLNAMAEAIDEAFGAPNSLSVWVFRQCLKDRNLSRVMLSDLEAGIKSGIGVLPDWKVGSGHMNEIIVLAVSGTVRAYLAEAIADRATRHTWIETMPRRMASIASSGDRATI